MDRAGRSEQTFGHAARLAEIAKIAEAAGAQVLMEVVTRSEAEDKTVSFVIEEGKVKA